MNLGAMLLVFGFLLFGPVLSRAVDIPPVKTEYYEAATNGATKVNYKLWKTVRAGQMLMTREERDIAGDGTFSSVAYLVYHNGQKLFQFTSNVFSATERRCICIFFPVSGARVMQSDTDGNGRYERLTVMDANGKRLETFAIALDGGLTLDTEAFIREEQATIDRVDKEMKERFK